MRLRALGEENLLAQVRLVLRRRNPRIVSALKDDCAVVKFPGARDFLLLKTDCVVEGVHFQSKASARAIGWKAMARTLSDFAAMSSLPEFALITLVVSPGRKNSWVRDLYRGLNQAAACFDVVIVGGETSSTRGPATVNVCASGRVEPTRCVFRGGGKAGDDLFVTGTLGGSLRARHLNFVPRIKEARWLTAKFKIHAMMDLSDGLGADLPRLARASKLNFTIDQSALPLSRGSTVQQAISDGEDYELLFAISARERVRLEKSWRKKFPRLPLTRIGKLVSSSVIRHSSFPPGYVHFQKRR